MKSLSIHFPGHSGRYLSIWQSAHSHVGQRYRCNLVVVLPVSAQLLMRAASAPWTAPQSDAIQSQSIDEALLCSGFTHLLILHLLTAQSWWIGVIIWRPCHWYKYHGPNHFYNPAIMDIIQSSGSLKVHKKIKVAVVCVWFHTKVTKCNCLYLDIWIYLLELLIVLYLIGQFIFAFNTLRSDDLINDFLSIIHPFMCLLVLLISAR